MRVSKARDGPITAVFRIRGQTQSGIVSPCEGWEQAIQKARHWLPHFEQRNPWIFLDSRQQKLYVLLDPDTEPQTTTRQSGRARRNPTIATKKGTRL